MGYASTMYGHVPKIRGLKAPLRSDSFVIGRSPHKGTNARGILIRIYPPAPHNDPSPLQNTAWRPPSTKDWVLVYDAEELWALEDWFIAFNIGTPGPLFMLTPLNFLLPPWCTDGWHLTTPYWKIMDMRAAGKAENMNRMGIARCGS